MNAVWKLQDAKSRFSQLVNEAIEHGPQYVSRHGTNAVVVMAANEYEALISGKPPLNDFLLSCPVLDDEFDLERQKDLPRSMAL